jgi:hypothetical protein
MWDCEHCGCQAIAGTITSCPQCHTPRYEDVPAESSGPDASATDTDGPPAVDRETPQAPTPAEPDLGEVPNLGDWGKSDG